MSARPQILGSVMRELLAESIGPWRIKRELLRLQRSQFARDQFMQGYRTGYHKGRADEKLGAFNILEPDRDPPHRQVDLRGIEVDEGMRELLAALWNLGLWTQFSCQGDPEKFAPHQSYSRDYAAQIVFDTFEEAVKFTRKTAAMLGPKNFTEGGVVLATMAPIDGKTPRAEVTFSPVLLSEITQLWAALDKTTPPATTEGSRRSASPEGGGSRDRASVPLGD